MTGQADRVAPAGMVLVTGDELAEAVASVRGTVVAVLGPSGNGDVVEDVLQSTWESAWHSRERFDPDRSSLRTWVGTIARNRAVDHLRAVGRSRAGQEALEASAVAREKTAVSTVMEDPAEAKKRGSKSVVRRDLVRVVTPGTLTEDSLLDARGANRLAAVAVRKGRAAVAVVELSSGAVDSVACSIEDLGAALAAFRPSEVLVTDRMFSDPDARAALDRLGLPSALTRQRANGLNSMVGRIREAALAVQ